MKAEPHNQSREELLKENLMLRNEVRVARRASEITAQLVAEQFTKIEEILLRLEQKAKAERELGCKLAEQLQQAEDRESQLAYDRLRLEQMQIVAVNMMEDIAAARATAEQATCAKSEFLANMSHEIRTPMTAILGYIDLLAHGCPGHCEFGDRAAPNHIETIRRNAGYLLELINSILDLSKIEAGKLVIERLRCSPIQIVAEVQSLMSVRAGQKKLDLTMEFATPVPEFIYSDPLRLRQVLLNLVGNAVKFTQKGGVRVVTRYTAAPDLPDAVADEGILSFEVIDTGIGMTDDQMEGLFESFYQADSSTTRKFGGTGLGLAISHRIAALLGGKIEVESREGEGSTFRFIAAANRCEDAEMIADPSLALRSRIRTGRGEDDADLSLDCRLLLAEDGPDNRLLLATILQKAGASVRIVENGKEALDTALAAAAEGDAFDAILMDMQMPIMDGYAAARALRASGYTGPIIALTAHAMAGDRDKCIEAGCDDYASKPIDKAALLRVIRHYTCDARPQVVAPNA